VYQPFSSLRVAKGHPRNRASGADMPAARFDGTPAQLGRDHGKKKYTLPRPAGRRVRHHRTPLGSGANWIKKPIWIFCCGGVTMPSISGNFQGLGTPSVTSMQGGGRFRSTQKKLRHPKSAARKANGDFHDQTR